MKSNNNQLQHSSRHKKTCKRFQAEIIRKKAMKAANRKYKKVKIQEDT